VRAAPSHPWPDPAVTGDPGHVPARPAVAVDDKERKLARATGKAKVHLLGAVTHVTGLVTGQDKVAESGKAPDPDPHHPRPASPRGHGLPRRGAGRPHRADVAVKKNGTRVMRNCEAVLYITSLAAGDASPEDLLARIRGHRTVEHLHWIRDVIWREDKSLIRTGNALQVMSASPTSSSPHSDTFAFSPGVRKLLYTTSSIESVNYQLRKVTKARGHFLTGDSVLKLLWLALIDIEDKRARERAARRQQVGKRSDQPAKLVEGQRVIGWREALAELDAAYPGRLRMTL
jgi:predicted transposase YbfD/YdcC